MKDSNAYMRKDDTRYLTEIAGDLKDKVDTVVDKFFEDGEVSEEEINAVVVSILEDMQELTMFLKHMQLHKN